MTVELPDRYGQSLVSVGAGGGAFAAAKAATAGCVAAPCRWPVPPAEHEGLFYRHNPAAATAAASVPSLH